MSISEKVFAKSHTHEATDTLQRKDLDLNNAPPIKDKSMKPLNTTIGHAKVR